MSDRLPSRDDILSFIRENPSEVGKREIARAFRVKGANRIALKHLLAQMQDDGLIDKGGRKRLRVSGALPPVGVIEVTHISSDGEPVARPQSWDGDEPAPLIILTPQKKSDPSVGIGDRVLAKLRQLPASDPFDYEAKAIRKLGSEKRILGVYRHGRDGGRVAPVEKGADREYRIESKDRSDAQDGELVEVETLRGPKFGLQRAKIIARLGDVGAPRSISLIAIHEHGIPTEFSEAAVSESETAKPVTSLRGREDLRGIPLVTIDPADARDHDDAVYAEPDPDPKNKGGFILWVAIADVAHYVRPGTALDREARRRGNSAYFPDRVVPMLPESLSADLCSLHENVDRPCLGVRIVIGPAGAKRSHAFFRGLMRSAASLTYEDAQAMADGGDGPMKAGVIDPLFACYRALVKARERRQPLDLDLPERKIVLNAAGEVESVRFRERFDAHKLIEECMVLANVCAAETLEQKRQAFVYRVHEPPVDERIEALRETLVSIGIPLAKGQRMTPGHLNSALRAAQKTEFSETVSMAVLRAQTQAYYGTDNLGHFGLNLAKYAHFTSPIRRYADLIVHRALISALGLGTNPNKDGLNIEEIQALAETATHISQTERRAMLAERDSNDRYLAAFMENRVGAEFDGVVSGIARFGMFVKLNETGADGLIPISTIGDEYYQFDEDSRTLRGDRTGTLFRMGMPLRVRLEEAVPLTGGLRFSLLDGGGSSSGKRKTRPKKSSAKPRKRPDKAKRRKMTRRPPKNGGK